GRVVPRLDLSEIDVGEHRSRELQLAGDAGNVVDRHHPAEHSREVQDRPGRRLQLLFGHRTVRGAEKYGLVGDLLDAAARPDRLVVDANVRVQLVVLAEPLRIDRIGECGAGAVDLQRLRGGRGTIGGDGVSVAAAARL